MKWTLIFVCWAAGLSAVPRGTRQNHSLSLMRAVMRIFPSVMKTEFATDASNDSQWVSPTILATERRTQQWLAL